MALPDGVRSGTLLTVREGGFVACPECARLYAANPHWRPNRALLRIEPETEAQNLTVKCRCCRKELRVNIDKGLRCYLA